MTTITIIQAAMIIFFPPWIRWAASSSSSSQRALAPACTVTNQNLHGTPLLQFSFLLAIVPIVAVVVQVVAANSGRDHSATATQNGDALHCYYSGSSIIRICQLENVNFQFAVTTAALTSQPASQPADCTAKRMTWEYCWQKDWENENENENKTESRLSDELYQKERTAERQNGQKCLSCGGRACGISNGHLAKRIDEHNWERWERAIEQLNKLRLANKWMNQLN